MNEKSHQKCEICEDTGFYGDNGAGVQGNREYVACDYCTPVERFRRKLHVCSRPGLIMGESNVRQQDDGSYLVTEKIGYIFGSEVEGQIEGKGATKEEALANLKKNRDDLYESLWV